jgi:hypothetical protein
VATAFHSREQIAEAREQMEHLKYAVIAHEETHGCAPPRLIPQTK